MANSASPPSFSTSHNTLTSTISSTPSDLSPSSLDTLPVLTAILTRLQASSSGTDHTTGATPQTQTQTQSQSQTQPSPAPHNPFSTTPLTTKDIPAATDSLKHRLQKARLQVAQLPDIERGIDEQEEEIRDLEEKIEKQREALEKLREMGLAIGRGDDGTGGADQMEM